jgi:hypothetical protein
VPPFERASSAATTARSVPAIISEGVGNAIAPGSFSFSPSLTMRR